MQLFQDFIAPHPVVRLLDVEENADDVLSEKESFLDKVVCAD
jgi:hypothetical protein